MKVNSIQVKEILDFEKEIGRELIVNERFISAKSRIGMNRFYVEFEKSSILGDGVLIGSAGNGNTIDEALVNYCSIISGETLVFDEMTPDRIYIKVPKLIHTEYSCTTNKGF
jgi:hypothetical protein